MATGEGLVGLPSGEATKELTLQWRRLIRTATMVAVLTSPVVFFFFREEVGVRWGWALFWTFLAVIAFRGLMDLIVRRFIPWPSLFGTDEPSAREEDVVNRRRAWYWGKWYRRVAWVVGIITVFWVIRLMIPGGDTSWISTITDPWETLKPILANPANLAYAFIFPLFFIMNFVILMGPMMLMGITQMQGFPGPETPSVGSSSTTFAGRPKRRRKFAGSCRSGSRVKPSRRRREARARPLFLGRSRTGKTMLSKAIATASIARSCPCPVRASRRRSWAWT